MGDKDVDGIIAALDRAAALDGARIIATRVQGERALAAGDLARRWQAIRPAASVRAIEDTAAALDDALEGTGRATGTIVVAGSLYLVGEARRRWLDDPRLRDPEVPGA
jgi:folylpolyglutamate synthase/dihydropteroate synthase